MSKIFFVSWVPDTCKAKTKMLYASSKQALRNALDGVQLDHQATDYDEITPEELNERAGLWPKGSRDPLLESGGVDDAFISTMRDGAAPASGTRRSPRPAGRDEALRREDFNTLAEKEAAARTLRMM